MDPGTPHQRVWGSTGGASPQVRRTTHRLRLLPGGSRPGSAMSQPQKENRSVGPTGTGSDSEAPLRKSQRRDPMAMDGDLHGPRLSGVGRPSSSQLSFTDRAGSLASMERHMDAVDLSSPMQSRSPNMHHRPRLSSVPFGLEARGFGLGLREPSRSQMTEVSCATQDTTLSQTFARRLNADFDELSTLGAGNFGEVLLCRERATGELFAVKRSPPLPVGSFEARRMHSEARALAAVRGRTRHLLLMCGSWTDAPVQGRARQYIMLQYCPGGSLAELLAHRRAAGLPWGEDEVRSLLAQLAIALHVMHSAHIAHVDVKPDNVLVDGDMQYVLGDLGCAQFIDPATGRPVQRGQPPPSDGAMPPPDASFSTPQTPGFPIGASAFESSGTRLGARTSTAAQLFGGDDSSVPLGLTQRSFDAASVDEGDCRYVAPDMLNAKRHFLAGDVFSLGMTVLEVMLGAPLPRNGDAFDALRVGGALPASVAGRYSTDLCDTVRAMLRVDPTQRPAAAELLRLPLFTPGTFVPQRPPPSCAAPAAHSPMSVPPQPGSPATRTPPNASTLSPPLGDGTHPPARSRLTQLVAAMTADVVREALHQAACCEVASVAAHTVALAFRPL